MKESNPITEPIGQNLIKLISNLCFSVFVFSVLIFTVIAITYQPPDPWLESAPALTKFFTKTENATFKDDSSILKTGEDLQAMPLAPSVPPVSSITEVVIEKSEEEVKNMTVMEKSDCDELRVVNCSDPRVLIAVERFNLRLFKSIVFLEYQKPVNGSKANECDVAWRFRNKKEKSWRKYRDFRRFRFGYGENCTYKIVRAGGWHSGFNARRSFRNRVNATSRSVGNPKVAPAFRDDEINDTIPTLGSLTNFRKGKYLYYSRGGDYCKGMNQYMWSFLCGLGEAIYLNRTFVMDLSVCLAATYNPSNKDEEGKDFRYYFDFEHLKEVASVVEEGEFLRDWKKWDRGHKRKVPVKKVVTHKVTPPQLKKDKSTIIWRQFDSPEPENYWYRVCEGQAAKYIQRPWHALWKSKRLMNIVTEISGQMDWDFDAVHVVRGEGRGGGTATVDKEVDFANYFCTYAFLYHQKEMLSDRVRMDAYFNSIFQNKHHFQGKTVLDVGTGSGILAIWSAQAGARKVYAVEATKMSDHARTLVKANNLQDVVEVIEGSVEDIVLPEKVDVIISEWMGYFLLRESMFDSVICARDRWLKPTGVMYPSHARMWVAPIRSGLGDQKQQDYEGALDDWYSFLKETKTYYGVDMSVLTKPFSEEQKKYYLQTSLWSNLHPDQVIGTAAVVKNIDCSTATVDDIREVRSKFLSSIRGEGTRLCGFSGWFDVHFRGSTEDPAQQEIELTTAPSTYNGTHWGQQVFLFRPSVRVSEGDDLNVSFSMTRSKENHRLLEVEFSCEIRESTGQMLLPIKNKFYIE